MASWMCSRHGSRMTAATRANFLRVLVSGRCKMASPPFVSAIVSAAGHDFELVVGQAEDDPVLAVDAYAPPSGQVVLQGFGIADAGIPVALNALDERVDSFERSSIILPGEVVRPSLVVPDFMHGQKSRHQLVRVRDN